MKKLSGSYLKEMAMDLNFSYRWEKSRIIEKLWTWLAWKLPKPLVLWATIRLMASATTGEYSATVVPEFTCVDALKRWK